MSSKDFLAKLKKSQEAFREGRAGKGGGFVQVENGKFITRFQSMELDVNDKGVPFVQINSIVVHADDDADIGLSASQRTNINALSGTYVDKKTKKTEKWEITEADQFKEICSALIAYGCPMEDYEISDLPAIATQLEEEQPAARVTVKTNKKEFKYLVWGKPVDDENLPSIEDVLDEEDEDEEDDADDDDDDDDDDVAPPVKGEEVTAQPKTARVKEKYKVLSINVKAETCTLQRIKDDKKFMKQDWSCIS